MKTKKNQILLGIIALMFVITSCGGGGTTAPLVERENAVKEIDLAKSVNAQDYAEELFEAAENKFGTGEELIDREKKSENNAKAKEEYQISLTNARLAYEKAVHPYTEALIAETEGIINAVSGKIDPITKKNARELNDQARNRLKSKGYDQAKRLTMEARKVVENAVEPVTLGNTARINYVVVKGDNLWNISKRNLGNPYLWPDIYELNTEVIGSNPDLIYPDQILNIEKRVSE